MDNTSAEKTAKRVAKNTASQAAQTIAIVASKLLLGIVIARLQGPEALGDFTRVMTFTLAFMFLNNFGLNVLMMRDIAQQRDRIHDYLDNALTICLGLGLLSVPVMGAVAILLGQSQVIVLAVCLTAVALMLETFGHLFAGAFSGYERMELGALAIIVQEAAFLVIGALVLFLQLPFLWLFVIYILSRFIGLIASIDIYRRIWKRMPRLGFDWPLIKILGRKTLPFAVNIALSPVFARVDILILDYFHGKVAVGIYEAASTLFYRLNVLARMVNLPIMPLIAREYPTEGKKVVGYLERAIKIQAVVALPITIAAWVVGGHIITGLYTDKFDATVIAFQIMASITFLRFLDHALGVTLTAIGLEARRSLATGALAVFNVVINLLVLPRFSYVGAAVTSVLTEIGYFVLLYWFVRTRLPNPLHLRDLVKPALASFVMGVPLWLMRGWPILVSLPIGLVVYGVATIALRVLSPGEMEFLLKISRMQRFVPPRLRRMLMGAHAAGGAPQSMGSEAAE